MDNSDFLRIKQKMMNSDPKKYWGDDYDVRFYLITKLKKIKNKSILDVGGGIGIINSEINSNNLRINLDLTFQDLMICEKKVASGMNNICGSMNNLPFIDNFFDYVICSHVIEIAKLIDVEKNRIEKRNQVNQFPTVENTLSEIARVLKSNGILFLTTPNNAYYKTKKLDYSELKNSLNNHFSNYSLSFFNTYPRFSKKYRKLNFANVIPKLRSKTTKYEKLLNSLIKKDQGKDKESVSFYVEAIKN